MYYNFKKSIKGDNGNLTFQTINTRNMLIFVKVNNYKVNCHLSSYSRINEKPSISLTENYIQINSSGNNYIMQYIIGTYGLSNDKLMNVRLNWVRTGWLYTLSDDSKIVPYKGLKITYDGLPYMTKHPDKYIKETEKLVESARSQRNAASRARYHNNRAEERLERSRVFYKREVTTEEVQQGYDIGHRIDMTYAFDTIPMTDIFKLWNVSQRRLLIEHYGIDNVIATLDSKVVDKDTVKGNKYELVVVKMPDASSNNGFRKATYLRMINPSTGETHFEGVPNVIRRNMDRWEKSRSLKKETVLCALAWRNNDDVYTAPEILT